MTLNRLILLILFLITFYSCSSERKIIEIMQSCRIPESSSLYSSNLIDSTKIISINADNIFGIDSLPNINNTKGFILPLIFVNGWNYQYNCQIGEINFIHNIRKNIQDNLYKLIANSGSLKQNHFYKISISLDTIKSNIPYKNKGVLIYALFSYLIVHQNYAGPSGLIITMSYKIEDENHILKSGIITQSGTLPPLKNTRFSFKKFVIEYYENYLELFNVVIQNSCEDINNEINKLN